jgi:glycosyltransferase involved in cell wall biosynthesis
MKLSVVIPAYNESLNLQKILKDSAINIKSASIDSYEIIICDDHSNDDTREIATELAENNLCKYIRLSRRSGSHVAIRAGLEKAKGENVLVISADGQDDANILPKMLQQIEKGKQIVWGVRRNRQEPFFHKHLSQIFYRLLSWFVPNENNIDLANADFYLLNRVAVDAINSCQERNTSLFGLIAWIGFDQGQEIYERKERYAGQSKWNFKSKMKLTLDWIIAFSGIPLKLITHLGSVFAIVGFLYALYIVVLSLLDMTTPGWAETVILMLLIGGIQMIMIGVVGEYLWRTLEEGRKRPLYFKEKEIDNEL